jgi:hypothetical protein
MGAGFLLPEILFFSPPLPFGTLQLAELASGVRLHSGFFCAVASDACGPCFCSRHG